MPQIMSHFTLPSASSTKARWPMPEPRKGKSRARPRTAAALAIKASYSSLSPGSGGRVSVTFAEWAAISATIESMARRTVGLA
jgi:hypothetical protein